MPIKSLIAGRWAIGVALALTIWFGLQVMVVMAAGPETYAMPQVVAQVPSTPTPFRFLTPTPIARTTTTTTSSTAPSGGGFPIELALPALAGGLAAIGGGSVLLRRKPTR